MARVRIQAYIRDEAGNKLGGTGYEVRFYQRGTNTLATLYPDSVNVTSIPNPHYPNAGVQTSLQADYLAGNGTPSVISANGFQAGDFITFDDGTNRSESTIMSIASQTFTLASGLSFNYTAALTRVNGRENLGYVAAWVDTSTDIEMTVKNLSTGIEGPRELFLVKPVSDYVKQGDPFAMPLAGAQASVTFANLPANGHSVHFRWAARANNAVLSQDLRVRLNSDATAGNYDFETAEASASAWAFVESIGTQTSGRMGVCTGTTAAAGLAGEGEFSIYNYAGTAFQKVCDGRASIKLGTASGNFRNSQERVWWRSTAAVTSVTFLPAAGSFDVGSAFYAYVD